MTPGGWILMGLFVLVGVIGSALYSGAETGLYTLSRVRLDVRSSEGDRRARSLKRLVAKPALMLAVLLLANNICNYMGSYGIAGMLNASGFTPGQSVVINAIILVPLLFVFGEVLPKDLFRQNTDRWSYSCAGLIEGTRRLLTWTGLAPLVAAVGSKLGHDDSTIVPARQRMASLLREGMSIGVLTESQTELVDRALLLRDRPVINEMIAWESVQTITADADASTRSEIASSQSHTRLPVVDEKGHVTGIVSIIDLLLHPEQSMTEQLQRPVVISTTLTVQEAMAHLRDHQASMAIIQEGDKPRGIVTMKDLVEVLIGELTAW
ncbi:MAG: CNNM domain-containing protein [Phycisphaerales bacterium]|nr:CNNM domain-containing protein [Phycisphaerales bacterium]